MIQQLGWKQLFVVLMLVGFAWALVWWLWFRDEPAEHRGIAKQELDYILAHRQEGLLPSSREPSDRAGRLGSRRSLNLWLMMVQYFGSNFTFFFSLTWLYPYVKTKYNLAAVDAGLYAMLPLLGGAAGNIFSGWLVDALYRSGRSSLSRKLPAIAGFALAALGMLMSVEQATVGGAVFWLTVAIFGADMTLSPSWSFCIDIGGQHAGAVSGTMNMAGNLGAAITALAFAYLPETSRGNVAFFYTAAALSGVAIVCWLLANPARRMEAST
jgi:ACS family glucarate transporter-like MFS transporter